MKGSTVGLLCAAVHKLHAIKLELKKIDDRRSELSREAGCTEALIKELHDKYCLDDPRDNLWATPFVIDNLLLTVDEDVTVKAIEKIGEL